MRIEKSARLGRSWMVMAGALGLCLGGAPLALAAPCMEITLTGTGGGPPLFNGLAGAGTLVRFGDDSNDCDEIRLQFDAGRGTNMRLSRLGLIPAKLTRTYYDKKRAEGKKHNQAIRSLGRHLVRVLWKMLTEDRDYEIRS